MTRPRVVIGMMQRDEETWLEAWILHHARLFGFDALHISIMARYRQIAAYAGTGSHAKEYLTATRKNYDAKFFATEHFFLPWFVPLCEAIGVPKEFLAAI